MKITVVKIGGHVIDDNDALNCFLDLFAALEGAKILVHGGGAQASKLCSQIGIQPQMVEGRRITDAQTLQVVTMVYAGAVNKDIVARLQARHVQSLGLSGADGNLIRVHKRIHPTIDFGFVGDIDEIKTEVLLAFIEQGFTPIIAPITHDGSGQLFNTNADTIVAEVSVALAMIAEVTLIYCFEKAGVLRDVADESSVIRNVTSEEYSCLADEGRILKGMIPKLDNAFRARKRGVHHVRVCSYRDFNAGTDIV